MYALIFSRSIVLKIVKKKRKGFSQLQLLQHLKKHQTNKFPGVVIPTGHQQREIELLHRLLMTHFYTCSYRSGDGEHVQSVAGRRGFSEHQTGSPLPS